MVFDIDMIRKVYASLPEKINQAKKTLQRPLTLTEKIIIVTGKQIGRAHV